MCIHRAKHTLRIGLSTACGFRPPPGSPVCFPVKRGLGGVLCFPPWWGQRACPLATHKSSFAPYLCQQSFLDVWIFVASSDRELGRRLLIGDLDGFINYRHTTGHSLCSVTYSDVVAVSVTTKKKKVVGPSPSSFTLRQFCQQSSPAMFVSPG